MKIKTINIENYVERLISFRPRSQFEIEQRLTQKKYPKKEINRLVAKLKQNKLIDDQVFARLWISYRENLNPKGKRLLRLELKQKGISETIIESALSEYSEDHEIDLALRLIERKVRDKKILNDFKTKQKIFAFLARHGFDYNISKKALEFFTSNDNI